MEVSELLCFVAGVMNSGGETMYFIITPMVCLSCFFVNIFIGFLNKKKRKHVQLFCGPVEFVPHIQRSRYSHFTVNPHSVKNSPRSENDTAAKTFSVIFICRNVRNVTNGYDSRY